MSDKDKKKDAPDAPAPKGRPVAPADADTPQNPPPPPADPPPPPTDPEGGDLEGGKG